MNAKDIRELTDQELSKELADSLKKQLELKLQQATGQLSAGTEVTKLRKHIARLKTVINSKANA